MLSVSFSLAGAGAALELTHDSCAGMKGIKFKTPKYDSRYK